MTDAAIAGVDEAGRGPLAGPVVAAAVILGDSVPDNLGDSKKRTALQREALFEAIQLGAASIGIGSASPTEIDQINILHATMLAMQRAVQALDREPSEVLVDGNRCPELSSPVLAVVGGDDTIPAISAASIIAKVTRDRLMLDYHESYPGYGFNKHKGYPTKDHLRALEQLGPCEIHRRSFAPVRRCLR